MVRNLLKKLRNNLKKPELNTINLRTRLKTSSSNLNPPLESPSMLEKEEEKLKMPISLPPRTQERQLDTPKILLERPNRLLPSKLLMTNIMKSSQLPTLLLLPLPQSHLVHLLKPDQPKLKLQPKLKPQPQLKPKFLQELPRLR
jgi:hypothetical protein